MAAQKEIVALTGLRGVAASVVALYHLSALYSTPGAAWHVPKGYLCVDIFFVLSGFVMATTYRHMFVWRVSFRDYRRFLYLRVARIWPLYLVATLLAIFIYHPARLPAQMLLANLFMVQGWGIAQSLNVPLWSVSAEFAAYLLFPFLFLFLAGARKGRLALTVAAAFLIIGASAWINAHDPAINELLHRIYGAHENGILDLYAPYSGLPVARAVGGFMLGVAVWFLSRHCRIAAVTNGNGFGLACAGLILVLTAAGSSDLVIYPLFPLLVLSLAEDKGLLAKILGSPVIRYLGVLSFAIYALQGPVFAQLRPHILILAGAVPPGWSAPVTYGAALAGLLIAAMLAHYLIEKPSRLALRMRLRLRAEPAAA